MIEKLLICGKRINSFFIYRLNGMNDKTSSNHPSRSKKSIKSVNKHAEYSIIRVILTRFRGQQI